MKRITIDRALDLYMNKREEFDKLYYKDRYGQFFLTAPFAWIFRETQKGEEWYFLTTEFYEKEEEKFFLKANRVSDGLNFLNKSKRTGYLSFSAPEECDGLNFQTKFNNAEISQLPEWCQHLERVLVEEEK